MTSFLNSKMLQLMVVSCLAAQDFLNGNESGILKRKIVSAVLAGLEPWISSKLND